MPKTIEQQREYRREQMRKYRANNPEYVDRAREHARVYATKHKEKRLRYIKDKAADRRKLLHTYKDKPCMDCGQKFPPYVMDFDHVNGEKVQNIGEMLSYSIESILTEISKCEVVCANCHRIRTYERQHRNNL